MGVRSAAQKGQAGVGPDVRLVPLPWMISWPSPQGGARRGQRIVDFLQDVLDVGKFMCHGLLLPVSSLHLFSLFFSFLLFPFPPFFLF